MNIYKHIKPEIIEQSMFNNEEMIKEFIALYRTQTPIDFEKLTKAVQQTDHQQIMSAAHHIKPTMEYIGASYLKDQLQLLETSAKEMAAIDHIQSQFNSLKIVFDELFNELEQYEKSL